MKSIFFSSLLFSSAITAQWADDSSPSSAVVSAAAWQDNAVADPSAPAAAVDDWAPSSEPAPTTSPSSAPEVGYGGYGASSEPAPSPVTTAAAVAGYGSTYSSSTAPAAVGYGAAPAAAEDDVVYVTSTVQVTKTMVANCCGDYAATAYGALGTGLSVNTNGLSLNGTAPFSNGTISSPNNGTADPVINQAGSECVGPAEEGADCSGDVGCCGDFSCDFNSLTCVSPDKLTAFNGTSSDGGNGTVAANSDQATELDPAANLTDNNAENPDDSEQGEAGPDDVVS